MQKCRSIKVVCKAVQTFSATVTIEIVRQKIVEIHIGHNARIPSECRAQYFNSAFESRMRVGKTVDLPVQQNTVPYSRRVLIIATSFYKITNEISHLQSAVVTRKEYVCKIIQN